MAKHSDAMAKQSDAMAKQSEVMCSKAQLQRNTEENWGKLPQKEKEYDNQ